MVLSAAAGLLSADVPPRPLPVNVSVPAVAAGGLAQIRVTLAAPHRISACRLSFDLDPAVFGPPAAVDVFSATGDQTGVAAIDGNHIDLTFGSASGGIGRLPGVPIFVIDVPALASAPKTATIVIPSASPPQKQSMR